MKLKLIALAAMLAAGSAQAAIDTGLASGNGELMLNLKWKDSSLADGNQSVSAAFDLGVTMNDAATTWNAAGFSRSWNLNDAAYGGAFASFLASPMMVLGNAEMNVFALDGTGTNPGDTRIVSTTSGINAAGSAVSLLASSVPSNANFNNIFTNTIVNNFLVGVNGSSNHGAVANGASIADATSGSAWFDNGTGMDKFGGLSAFDSTGKFDGSYAAGTGILAGQARALPFYMVVASSTDPFGKTTMTPFGADLDGDGVVEFDNGNGVSEYGLWTLQGSTLTYSVAAAVPEAETYAMMLAGLGLVGFMVRRRKFA